MRILLRNIIVLVLLCVATPLLSQENGLDPEAWEGTVDGINFFEKRETLKPVDSSGSDNSIDFDDAGNGSKSKNPESRERTTDSSSGNFNIPSGLSYVLMALIIGILIYFIVYTIIKNPNVAGVKKVGELSEEDISNIEVNLFDNDLEKYIHEAKVAGNYKLAIRFSFIYIIRLLAENDFIRWGKQKTNHDYLGELENHSFKETFNYCRLVFENLWYSKTHYAEGILIQTLDLYATHIQNLKDKKNTS